jgi:hypothetical protein
MAFAPGQSGNPGGRPKDDEETKEVKALAKQHSKRALLRLVEWMESDNPKASVTACNSVMDRGLGKVAHAIIGGSEDDPPIVTRIERVIVRSDPKP